MKLKTIIITLLCLISVSAVECAMVHNVEFLCNTKAEKTYIASDNGSSILGTVSRYAYRTNSWSYKFNISPGAACRASVLISGYGEIELRSGAILPIEKVIANTKQSKIQNTNPRRLHGSSVKKVVKNEKLAIYRLDIEAPVNETSAFLTIKSTSSIRLQKVKFTWTDRDSNSNGISDVMESLMGASASNPIVVNKRPSEPHTSFQTPTGYLPENDIRTDSVIIYNPVKANYDSWKEKGYDTQTMYGFRTGDDYIKKFPGEGQTAADGTILTCGPGSYYMVPTQNRIDAALAYFNEAIDSGSTAVIPEEPEFFTQAGYSASFKQEWNNYYNEPWRDPTSSIDARWKSEQLKGFLEYRMIKSIIDDAKAKNPNVKRMVAAHSQISYYSGGIIYPHYKVFKEPSFQDLVGQVWTGTARAGTKYDGITAERTFEWGYLEYSSLYNLMRGSGKRLWFLMDPLEDNPDRTMEDYQENYEKTLMASMMFPDINEYEVMPWPTRIYGRVPDWFSTKIGTIVNMLSDMHNQKTSSYYMGTQGIATFVADSMAWERGAPYPSDFTDFHGMTLPLLMKGIPVQVAQLERTVQPGYLAPYKVLLLSYDLLKPMSPAYNEALAKWVKNGGTIILFGGSDPYNNLNEWWKTAGYKSPQEHLLAQLGIKVSDSQTLAQKSSFKPLMSEINRYHNAENKQTYTIDLTDRIADDGNVYVKFEDAFKDEGWGPLVSRVEILVNDRPTANFSTGTAQEKEFLIDDNGSQFNGSSRFADAQGYWIYKINAGKGNKVTLKVDMANEFMLSTSTEPLASEYKAIKASNNSLTAKYPEIDMHKSNEITAYKTDASPLYKMSETDYSPFFEQKVGNGDVIFIGAAPRYFASSKEAGELLRSIVAYGCEKAGLPYKETGYLGIKRGKYTAVRSFDKPFNFTGTFVNVLDPNIEVLVNPVVPVDGRRVLSDVTNLIHDSTPHILISSDRIEASLERKDMTSMLLTGPFKTKGIARLSTAGKQVQSVTAIDSTGKDRSIFYREDNDSLFLRYDALPEGVMIKIDWK